MKQLLVAIVALPSLALAAEDSAPALPKIGAGSGLANADIGGMLAAFVLVLGCLLLVSWFLRRSRLVGAPNQAGVNVIAQLPLNMKEKLLVVQVGEERLLLGATPGCIRTLHTWKADEPMPGAVHKNFSSLLSERLGGLKTRNRDSAAQAPAEKGAEQ